jgi:hypothetical protein
MARTPRPSPNEGGNGEWPTAKRADPIQEVARQFVLNVKAEMADASVRSVAKLAGLDHNTLRYVLAGDSWPDLIVIARLERHFGKPLWPGILD